MKNQRTRDGVIQGPKTPATETFFVSFQVRGGIHTTVEVPLGTTLDHVCSLARNKVFDSLTSVNDKTVGGSHLSIYATDQYTVIREPE